jgi:hypothetical protein
MPKWIKALAARFCGGACKECPEAAKREALYVAALGWPKCDLALRK